LTADVFCSGLQARRVVCDLSQPESPSAMTNHAILRHGAIHLKFFAQGIQQGKFSRKENFQSPTRINTGDLQSWELAGNLQGTPQVSTNSLLGAKVTDPRALWRASLPVPAGKKGANSSPRCGVRSCVDKLRRLSRPGSHFPSTALRFSRKKKGPVSQPLALQMVEPRR
jgi:hypothetical protein